MVRIEDLFKSFAKWRGDQSPHASIISQNTSWIIIVENDAVFNLWACKSYQLGNWTDRFSHSHVRAIYFCVHVSPCFFSFHSWFILNIVQHLRKKKSISTSIFILIDSLHCFIIETNVSLRRTLKK